MKGDTAISILFFLVIIFTTVITAIAAHYALSGFQSETADNAFFQESTGISLSAMENIDGLLAFLTGFLFLLVVISALIIDSHPVMFIFSALSTMVMLFVVPVLSNSFGAISVSDLGASAARFPIMTQVWQNAPLLVGVTGFLTAVILYGKTQYS